MRSPSMYALALDPHCLRMAMEQVFLPAPVDLCPPLALEGLEYLEYLVDP